MKGSPELTQLYNAGLLTFPLNFISKLIPICQIQKNKRNGGRAYVHATKQILLNALKCDSMIMQPFPFFSSQNPSEPEGGKECTNMYNRRYI